MTRRLQSVAGISRREFLALGAAAGMAISVPGLVSSFVPRAAAVSPSLLQSLNGGWLMRKFQSGDNGTELSAPGIFVADTQPAIVPGTVLTSLVANGSEPNPYFGSNRTSVPDLGQDHNESVYTYWFFRKFRLAQPLLPNGHIFLLFRGINYQASLFLNGSVVAPMVDGQFQRFSFDVTDLVRKGTNVLAVLITPPLPAGNPDSNNPGNPPPGHGPGAVSWPSVCQGGDQMLGESVTGQFSGGWDFVLSLGDRNAGIWDDVALLFTGPVLFASDPQITTRIAWPAAGDQPPASAEVCANVEINNPSLTGISVQVVLDVAGISKTVTAQIDPNSTLSLPITVRLPNPDLWWPNGQGTQTLYPAVVTLMVNGAVSDSYQCNIGVREISSDVDSVTGGRLFTINRRKVFIRGGNWCFVDAMLRHSAQNYDDQVHLHQLANLNLIRIWGGGNIERPEFYDACDKYGLLVWQEFPVTADCKNFDNPDGDEPFLSCAQDSIIMLRNHASLALWVGGNEAPPRSSLNNGLIKLIAQYDKKTDYVPYSTDFSAGFGPADGPYDIKDPRLFFNTSDGNSNAFNPEYGSVGFPVIESLRRFIPDSDLSDLNKILVTQNTFNELYDSWFQHHFQPFFSGVNTTPDQLQLYGRPTDIVAFCEQAQAAQYLQYKALFAGLNAFMWTTYSGGNLWRSQCGWPGMRGFLFDPYLEATGGFFGARISCAPISVQINLLTYDVVVVNNTSESLPAGLQIDVTFCDGTGKSRSDLAKSFTTSSPVDAAGILNVGMLPLATELAKTPLLIVRTKLSDASGKVLANNLDWISNATTGEPYAPLRNLPPVKLISRAKGRSNSTGFAKVTLTARNPGKTLAFFNRIRVYPFGSTSLLQPVFHSDNYFSLLPGERTTV
ncbi:MAG TPA: glycoside hydrolase family 2 TIM barrel-domain containing protein, partial [Candidatus Binataceae bacterium]|nr:glycoside hydrolase family 2 TIM barrel-domain containing protein [Candidatus Binataceae bacterium]